MAFSDNLKKLPGISHLAAIELKAILEIFLGVDARAIVGHQRHDLLDAILRRPVGDAHRGLRQGEAGAHDVR